MTTGWQKKQKEKYQERTRVNEAASKAFEQTTREMNVYVKKVVVVVVKKVHLTMKKTRKEKFGNNPHQSHPKLIVKLVI